MKTPPTPTATYRLQFHKDFTFRHALEVVEYLAALHISHLYASPILKARPGSTHGYDIVDHHQLNPELGTPADFEALVSALHARGIGLVLDIVPNHMGVGGKDNRWWLDVLEWGEDSPYATYFDIDWKTQRRGLRGKVLVPVLGDQYGKVLSHGELQLRFFPEQGSFTVVYFEHLLPIDPRDYERILEPRRGQAPAELLPVLDKLRELKTLKSSRAAHEAGTALKAQLAAAARSPAVAAFLTAAAEALQGEPGDLDSWTGLDALLEQQSFRAASWRMAADEINYRRFFNINDLAGVRVELPELFEETHRFIFQLMEDGKVQGLRVDHIDGLFDPQAYCERLQARVGRPGQPAYVVVEKILAPHEHLPESWPIAGTSGYDSLNLINGVFVDPAGEGPLDRFYGRYTGRTQGFDEVLLASKQRIMQVNLASEMNVLANELHRLSSGYLPTRDFTLRGLRDAIEQVLAAFPVYRTYVTPTSTSAQDRKYIEWAVAKARKDADAADGSIFDFIQAVLTGDLARDAGYKPDAVFPVAMRAQQISGPVMAKGMEDTAFYRYFRLISLNEVGGDPRRFGVSPAAFHRVNAERQKQWPDDLLASSTHDTKRGEDARARINLLSELPREWSRQVLAWSRLNRSRRTAGEGGEPMPRANEEYLFYQTLVGAWPLDLEPTDAEGMARFAARLQAFMQKAVREGKERSGWANPRADYEDAVAAFVRDTLLVSAGNRFPEQVAAFVDKIARWGAVNSLAQTLLRLTLPGVPDTYQGSELWDFSLVDPDNRRPVDYAARRALLGLLPSERSPAQLEALGRHWKDGREKLFLIRETLKLRAAHANVFGRGAYESLLAAGSKAEHVCAFTRSLEGGASVVVVIPRLVAGLHAHREGPAPWGDTRLALPSGSFRSLFTNEVFSGGGELSVEPLLKAFPVAVLVGT